MAQSTADIDALEMQCCGLRMDQAERFALKVSIPTLIGNISG